MEGGQGKGTCIGAWGAQASPVGKVSLSVREESEVSAPGWGTGAASFTLFPTIVYGFLELVAVQQ